MNIEPLIQKRKNIILSISCMQPCVAYQLFFCLSFSPLTHRPFHTSFLRVHAILENTTNLVSIMAQTTTLDDQDGAFATRGDQSNELLIRNEECQASHRQYRGNINPRISITTTPLYRESLLQAHRGTAFPESAAAEDVLDKPKRVCIYCAWNNKLLTML